MKTIWTYWTNVVRFLQQRDNNLIKQMANFIIKYGINFQEELDRYIQFRSVDQTNLEPKF